MACVEQLPLINSAPDKMNLSFSGCGFLCIYHAGVAAAIKEYAPQLTKNKISGASAGSIIAAGLICNVCISQATSTILTIVSQARSRAGGAMHPAFDIMGIVRNELAKTLPQNAYELCTNKLHISLTRWSDKKNVVVCTFDNNKELIDAIICSCFIPFYCGLVPPYYRGEQYIDGGFTDNQPTIDEHSIMVSPFSGESDICPPDWDSASFLCIDFSRTSIRLNSRNLFRLTACLMPPSLEDCSKMCLQGFEDALRFLTKNGMAPCIRCLATVRDEEVTSAVEDEGMSSGVENNSSESRALSPLLTRRTRSASNLQSLSSRKRGESDCDTCCESEHMYNARVQEVFPNVLRSKFEQAVVTDANLLDYVLSFRLVRFTRSALGLTKLPIDMMLMVAKNLTKWLSQVLVPEWVRRRLYRLIDFIYEEFDHQRQAYSARFSCQLSMTEEISRRPRRHYLLDTMELSEEAKKEKELLRARDRKKYNAQTRVADEWSQLSLEDNLDSSEHVVDYMRTHDSMYEFHYKGDDNKMHTFGLFNMQKPEKRHSCHSSHCSSPCASTEKRPVSMVVEEEEEPHSQSSSRRSTVHREEESGPAADEKSLMKTTRDACCSPVRDFDLEPLNNAVGGVPPTGNSATHAAHVRAAAASRGGRASTAVPVKRHPPSHQLHPRKAGGRGVLSLMSSDSEVDMGDPLFVPRSRQRTTSGEYDGEPEQSDTDQASGIEP